MSADDTALTTLGDPGLALDGQPTTPPLALGLLIVWSREEPERVGEVALLPPERGSARVLGRESAGPGRLGFARQRPGGEEPRGPLRSARISREQLLVEAVGDALRVRNIGRLPLKHEEQPVFDGSYEPGELLELDRELLLLVVRRPSSLPEVGWELHPFGEADSDGLVGESPTAWELRRQLAFCAATRDHVLVRGPSGAGKELAAQAIHRLGGSGREIVSRNAATLPEGILDAELFGNLKDYPNPGMVARSGMIGEADGSTLFLDEIGEISPAMQAHLLRVMDAGEYQRLGESRRRRSRFRLIGATNRALGELKHDFLARLTRRVEVPGLDLRREDVPLIARHLLRRFAAENPAVFPVGAPEPHPNLMRDLIRRPYTTHVRELSLLLWQALDAWSASGGGPYLRPPPLGPEPPRLEPSRHARPTQARAPTRAEPTREEILAAYRAAGGVQARVPAALGLRDRFQLLRLEKKLGISPADRLVATFEDEGAGE